MTSATGHPRRSEQHRVGAGLVLAGNPAVVARPGEATGVAYLDRMSDLSFGQLVETLPRAVDDAALRGHQELGPKTGTLSNVE